MVKFLFFSDKIFTPSNVSVACLIPDDSRAQEQDMAANNIQAQNPRIEEMDNPMDNSNRSSNNSSNNRSNQNQSKEWLVVKLNTVLICYATYYASWE